MHRQPTVPPSIRNLWWTKWHLHTFISKHAWNVSFPQCEWFHQCSRLVNLGSTPNNLSNWETSLNNILFKSGQFPLRSRLTMKCNANPGHPTSRHGHTLHTLPHRLYRFLDNPEYAYFQVVRFHLPPPLLVPNLLFFSVFRISENYIFSDSLKYEPKKR